MERRHTSSGLASESPAPDLHRCSGRDHEGERWLPRDKFWRRTASPNGLQNCCKDCDKREALARYYSNPRAARERNKRYRLLTGYVHSTATQERNKERKRRERLERRHARARLLLGLTAQEYGLEPGALMGDFQRSHGRRYPRNEAKAIVARLIRQYTLLPAEEIATLLDCTARSVRYRLAQARAWTRSDRGDVRVVERTRRISDAYRQHVPSRSQERAAR